MDNSLNAKQAGTAEQKLGSRTQLTNLGGSNTMLFSLDTLLSDPYRPATLHARLCSAAWMVGYEERPLDDAKDLMRENGYPWVQEYTDAFERGHLDKTGLLCGDYEPPIEDSQESLQ